MKKYKLYCINKPNQKNSKYITLTEEDCVLLRKFTNVYRKIYGNTNTELTEYIIYEQDKGTFLIKQTFKDEITYKITSLVYE